MSRKANLLILFLLLFFTTTLCSCDDVIVDPIWVIGVKGVDAPVFSSLDYGELRKVTVTIGKKQQDNSTPEETWEGVYLKDVLDYLGVAEGYSSITITSSDGFSVEYTPDIINDSLTVLATKVNGRDLEYEDGYTKIIAGNQPEDIWVDSPAKISINK
ncbi:MAG: molybdopterin-dependent oxidoreductase [Lachnospiraceae bacterium]|jgi:hypothetical protein